MRTAATAWRPEYTPCGSVAHKLQVITREQKIARCLAHRAGHHRGPPYRDSAIAAPHPWSPRLNSQFTGASVHVPRLPGGAPGLCCPSARPGRQYTSRNCPRVPGRHLKRLPRVAHLRAARPQARGDEEPTGKPRPAVRLPSTSVTQADCREAMGASAEFAPRNGSLSTN